MDCAALPAQLLLGFAAAYLLRLLVARLQRARAAPEWRLPTSQAPEGASLLGDQALRPLGLRAAAPGWEARWPKGSAPGTEEGGLDVASDHKRGFNPDERLSGRSSAAPPGPEPATAVAGGRGEVQLSRGWLAKRAADLGPGGAAAVTARFGRRPAAGAEGGWLPAVVPGSALATLVAAGQLPDPYQGLNNDLIPDLHSSGPEPYTLTWANSFDAPPGWDAAAGGRAWLRLGGANYSVAVHLNGSAVHVPQPAGMFLRRRLDVTDLLLCQPATTSEPQEPPCTASLAHSNHVPGGANCLALTVSPPDPPGCVDRGGQGGDHLIARSVTAQFVAGWDWAQPVRDRATGLWGAVSVRFTGPVALSDPHVIVSPGVGAEPEPSPAAAGSNTAEQSGAAASCSVAARLAREAAALGQSAALAATVVATNGGAKGCMVQLRCEVVYLGTGLGAGLEGCGEGRVELRWEERHALAGRASRVLRLAPPAPLRRPRLWWPLGLGGQPLYGLRVEARLVEEGGTADGIVDGTVGTTAAAACQEDAPPSDVLTERFGVRSVGSGVDPRLGGHAFFVNGERVFVRGGNWIAPDAMLRCPPGRCRREVELHAAAGLNMIRLWGGAGCTPPEFYAACDEAGILVWQEFWVTGDCNGRGATPDSPVSDPAWPDDHALFYACARDTVKALRNHPCLVLWCGGNEQTPAPDICAALAATLPAPPVFPPRPGQPAAAVDAASGRALLARAVQAGPEGEGAVLDPTRLFVPGSLWVGFGAGDGTFSDGPYGIQDPAAFFRPDFYPHAFNPEVGSVGVPVAESVLAMFPDPKHAQPPRMEPAAAADCLVAGPWRGQMEVANAAWQRHCYLPYGAPPPTPTPTASIITTSSSSSSGASGDLASLAGGAEGREVASAGAAGGGGAGYHALLQYGGLPEDVYRFCDLAQVANYVQYKALCEGWGSGMWSRFSGMLLWKSQAPWPGLRGQLYDWFLEETGGYWGAKAALAPLHVQLNQDTMRVEVVNTTTTSYEGATVRVELYSLAGLSHWHPHRRHHRRSHHSAAAASEAEGGLEAAGGEDDWAALGDAGLGFPRFVEGHLSAVPGRRTTPGFKVHIPWHKLPGGVCFVCLRLVVGRRTHTASRNVYWLADPRAGDFCSLARWCREGSAEVTLHVGEPVAGPGGAVAYSLRLHNSDRHRVAFWVRLRVVWDGEGHHRRHQQRHHGQGGGGGEVAEGHTALSAHRHRLEDCPRLLPTYSDNYLTLVPGEERTVSLALRASEAPPQAGTAFLLVKGWNVPFRGTPLAGFPGSCSQ